MKTNSISTIFLGLVLITGMFSFGLMSSDFIGAFAEKGGNGNSQGNPQGCDNGNGKDAAQNPNCGDGGSEPPTWQCSVSSGDGSLDDDGDGVCNADDICGPSFSVGPHGQSDRDFDGDGVSNNKDNQPCDPSIQ